MIVPVLFGLWTLFVWGGRLRNLATDPGGLAEASRWSLLGSVLFTVLGVALVASIGLGDRSGRRFDGPVVHALAALTVVVWAIRATDIALGDHEVGFIVVHVVLAVVSITLAALSVRAVRSRPSGPQAEQGRPSVRYPATDG